MTEERDRKLIVGVDPSKESLLAVDWAASEARARGTGLTVCHVYDEGAMLFAPIPSRTSAELRSHAQEVADQGVRRAAQAAPDVHVDTEIRAGLPAAQLLRLASDGAETVVGHRGSGGFADLLLGSVGAAVAAHASQPVVIVRPARQPDGPVLVGLDGSEHSPRALEYALRHAARHALSVQALHTFHDPLTAAGLAVPLPEEDQRHTRQAAADYLAEVVTPLLARFPDVSVERLVLGGPAARTLVDASLGASLVVVGRRGRGGFPGLHMGSASQAVLRHAHSPVAVVP